MRHRRAAALLAGLALALLGGCAQADMSGLPDFEYPPVGDPAPAACTPAWEPPAVIEPARGGPLVPEGGAAALLCTYPIETASEDGSLRLGDVVQLDDPARLIAYLNGLPTRPDVRPGMEWACTASLSTTYVVVIGYPDRQPAVVQTVCGFEQGGNRRYEGDLQTVRAFFTGG